MSSTIKTGDASSFAENWKNREESLYNHWVKGEPQNQIQFAFRNHWKLFNELISSNPPTGKDCLEVGCGRATMSSYFSDNGWKTTSLDLSPDVIDIAQKIFAKNNLKGDFVVGDVLNMPFKDNSFDVIVSIGLLEHFEDVDQLMKEQIRVLKPNGLFLGYVVPENKENIQKEYTWMNDLLRLYDPRFKDDSATRIQKTPIYRSTYDSAVYINELKKLPVTNISAAGVYPVPMISPSPDFPFTLMPPEQEKILLKHFNKLVDDRKKQTGQNGWMCEEKIGQAFLVWCWKK